MREYVIAGVMVRSWTRKCFTAEKAGFGPAAEVLKRRGLRAGVLESGGIEK